MAATVWKGYITFGLISVPVRLFTAARSERISFNQLHGKCHTRIKQQLYCPTCDTTVERSEIVKGYAYSKDHYVLVEDSEIKKVQPESSGGMEILEFVKLSDVDPLYFDSSYYLVPEEAGQKAYQLLVATMDKAGYAAIAKLAMHQREYTVLVRARKKGLTLHTMHYPDEIRELSEYGKGPEIEVKPQELQLAQQLVESLVTAFEPDKYHDQYQARLKELIEHKRAGEEVAATEAPRLAPVIDLMEALQKSLQARPTKKAPARATEAAAEAAPSKKPRATRKRKAG
jgi:DNA end-binding protein Ku